jgi:3-oxoacyl-[acyl-carrier-protein] synthase I
VVEEVHIVAVGARTPLGLTAEGSAAAVRAGISQLKEHPFIVDRMAEPVRMARDNRLDPKVPHSERLIEMAATALDEICGKLELKSSSFGRIPLLLALPEERPGWTREHSQAVIRGLSGKPIPLEFQPIEALLLGHAAGLIALEAACAWIQAGQAELCVIAGVDSYLELETLEWLDQNRQLATSYHRGAFFPGEGAGAFLVASESAVRRYGLDSLAVVRGTGVAIEDRPIRTDTVCLGEGLTESVRMAVAPLRLRQESVEGIICDINGERYRSEEWGFALLRLPEALADPTGYDLPASCWGDVGAASAPLFVMLAVTAGRRGWAKGDRYLIWNSSEGGQRAAVVLELNRRREGVHS